MNYHSITLEEDRCIGCTDCIKRCPTEAIRVKDGVAVIYDDLCIDCGVCINVCKYHAKRALKDSIDKMNRYKYKVAIVDPVLFTQFHGLRDPNRVLTALKKYGFDDVFDTGIASKDLSEFSLKYIEENELPSPVISTACPAISKLIKIRFPSLIDNLLPVIDAKELAARYVRKHCNDTGHKDAGIFYISPCAAKITNSRNENVIKKSEIDVVLSVRDVYKELYKLMGKLADNDIEMLRTVDEIDLNFASSGGESTSGSFYDKIRVDGIEEVIKVLEKVENNKFSVDFVECMACVNGCLGGSLNYENSFYAKNRILKIKNNLLENPQRRDIELDKSGVRILWDYKLEPEKAAKLDSDMFKALEKMERIEKIYAALPKIDCGSCGAPTCKALAEDIVRDRGSINDCIFMLKKKFEKLEVEEDELK